MRFVCITLLSIFTLTGCNETSHSVALGTLERDRIALTATANEVITALPVQAGSLVTAGTVLVTLDDTLQSAQVEKAKAELAMAQANLEKLRHGARVEEVASARAKVVGAKAALQESEANYTRIRALQQQKAVSQSERDKISAQRDANLANLRSAEESLLILTNGAREEDLRSAEAQVQAATATLNIELKRLADLTIVATRDGILDNLPWNLGERVSMGSPLAIVLSGNAPHARIYVPEPSRVNINIGSELVIHVDGVTDAIVGTVTWIASEPAFTPYYALNQTERSRLVYLAEVQLPDEFASLPSGLPVQVDL
ncbi:HlyD family efflux transporter periplasmic adaptor subunit [Alteromonadaceae bacterium BrNp21-10]|nr:HlyD family efflux transporter periplasmic adaptor subunit [Alteromonadaceae bacterium BrNp21-10]